MPHRKRSRKVSRKGRKTLKRGGYYGFNQSSPVGTGAAAVSTGQEVKTPSYAGARRRKSRRSTRRRVKGGTRFETSSAGYVGTGSRGVADYVDVGSTRGTSAMGSFNNYGAQPGSGGASFIKVN